MKSTPMKEPFTLNPRLLSLNRSMKVGRQSPDVSALIEEYLRFAYLRERLDGLLTLEPSALVDDAWHAHTASGR